MELPPVGLGTYRLTDQACVETVETALDLGYRHVDTAEMYGNEREVGAGIQQSDVAREDLSVATKLWHDSLARDEVVPATERCLDRLGLDRLDLLYVHWPAGEYDASETLPAFDELRDRGLVDHVGVSNFTPALLDEARAALDGSLDALQVECHPLLQQADLRSYCAEHDIAVVAYSPLARGQVADVPVIREIAERHDATPAQVALAWLDAKGVTAIPKASSEAHLRENLASRDLSLDAADVERIDALDREERVVDPGFAPW